MPIANVSGLNFTYEFHGSGEPLVLVSGTGMSGDHWKVFQVPELEKHFRVLTWDHRGTGRSDKPDVHYSTRMFADDCVNLMEALGLARGPLHGPLHGRTGVPMDRHRPSRGGPQPHPFGRRARHFLRRPVL